LPPQQCCCMLQFMRLIQRVSHTFPMERTAASAPKCLGPQGFVSSLPKFYISGWVSTNTQRGRCIQNYYCQHCGFSVPLRSRHCLQTGQCVHKFDHFCYLLSTSIGERPTRERRCYPGCHAFPMASCSWLQLSINAAIRPVSPWSTRLPWLQPLFPLGKLNPPSTRATALPFFSESRH